MNKKIEYFYFLLCYAYAKAYRKIWGKKLGSFEVVRPESSSYPIVWITFTFWVPVAFFSTFTNKEDKNRYLIWVMTSLIIIGIYSFIISRNKVKWNYYMNFFDQWIVENKKNKRYLILLLSTPIIVIILSVIISFLIRLSAV